MNYLTATTSESSPSRRTSASPSTGGQFGLRFSDIISAPTSHRRQETTSLDRSLEGDIFSSLANAKIWTSQVAMHMDLASRNRFFRQLDRLHDTSDWMTGEKPVDLESYKGFVRFMLSAASESKPSLAMNAEGNLLAIWLADAGRLTVQFKNDGFVEWVVSHLVGDNIERAAGKTMADRLLANLTPYEPARWLAPA